MSRRPQPQRIDQFDVASIPAELKQFRQWVCWKCVVQDEQYRKVPKNARTGRSASTTNPDSWSTFEEALHGWETHSGLSGIGFVFTADDPFTGIDLDNCLRPDGSLTPQAEAIVREFASYTEISPSGLGVKIIIRGKKPAEWRSKCRSPKQGGIEIFDRRQFFAITGRVLKETRP